MTVLFVDAGNSRVKFGWRLDRDYGAGCPREPAQAAFGYAELPDGLPAWLAALPEPPAAALGTNVAGVAAEHLVNDLLRRAGCTMSWVKATDQTLGLVNGYREPARLGADRWMGMVGIWAAARHAGAGEAATSGHLLAHFGTATTLDTIDEHGRFIGGLILPGFDLMRRSLAAGTADLPAAEGRVTGFPDQTNDAIVSGIAAAQAGAVMRQWLAAAERFGQPPRLYASGGAWAAAQAEVCRLLRAAGSTQTPLVVDNPVLDGLACLAQADPALLGTAGRPR